MVFFQLPKDLFTPKFANVSVEAKTLYSILLDWAQLSIRNGSKWRDQTGIFIYFGQRKMADALNCSLPTVRRRLKELVAAGLLVRKRRGLTFCDKLYVLPVTDALSAEKEMSVSERQAAFFADRKDPYSLDRKKDRANDTNPAQPDPNQTQAAHTDVAEASWPDPEPLFPEEIIHRRILYLRLTGQLA